MDNNGTIIWPWGKNSTKTITQAILSPSKTDFEFSITVGKGFPNENEIFDINTLATTGELKWAEG